MFILGLTGSIGMGKSETAKMFAALGVPVYDADAAVHAAYAKGGAAVMPVSALFPGVVRDGAIDRAALGAAVFGDRGKLRALEAIVHPIVAAARSAWLETQAARGEPLVVLDIPLLYESAAQGSVDAVLVVSAPQDVQRARVLARPGMSAARLDAILAEQTSDAEKRQRADYIIETDKGLDAARRDVGHLVGLLKTREGRVWQGERG